LALYRRSCSRRRHSTICSRYLLVSGLKNCRRWSAKNIGRPELVSQPRIMPHAARDLSFTWSGWAVFVDGVQGVWPQMAFYAARGWWIGVAARLTTRPARTRTPPSMALVYVRPWTQTVRAGRVVSHAELDRGVMGHWA